MKRLALLLALALALRLWLAPMRGHVHDVTQFKLWAEALSAGEPLSIYATSSANYPPLALLPLWVVGSLYRLAVPDFADSDWLTAFIKLPAVAADLLTVYIIYRLVAKRHSARRGAWMALLCAAGYAFNPAVWYLSGWWGQLEALYALPMLLAVAAQAEGRLRPGLGLAGGGRAGQAAGGRDCARSAGERVFRERGRARRRIGDRAEDHRPGRSGPPDRAGPAGAGRAGWTAGPVGATAGLGRAAGVPDDERAQPVVPADCRPGQLRRAAGRSRCWTTGRCWDR